MYKKITAALLYSTVLGSSLNAEEKSFLGLEVGYSEVQGERIDSFVNEDKDVSYGIRIGAQKNEWRSTLLYNYYDNSDSDQNVEQILGMADYFFLDNESTFKPYIGANIGYANYESSYVEDSGFIYGGQAGFVINTMGIVDLDFSYRYSLSNTDELDHIGSFIFAMNYNF
jgi:hypothetical protein